MQDDDKQAAPARYLHDTELGMVPREMAGIEQV